jgi:hypothetical protein
MDPISETELRGEAETGPLEGSWEVEDWTWEAHA